MTTLEILIQCHGATPTLSLEEAGRYWNYTGDTLMRKIDAGAIRLPYFRLDEDSQKSAKLVHIHDLAALIDARRAAAAEDFQKLWG